MPYTVGNIYANITLDIGQNISYYTRVWENMKIKPIHITIVIKTIIVFQC